MKLCVVGKYPPIEGGVSTNTYWLVRGLAERGHDVHVVTNAEEVEDEYRLALRPEDHGWFEPRFEASGGSVRVSGPQPYSRRAMGHIPFANPFVSKLASLATDVVRRERCEAILAYYYEPYGVAGWLASRWTDRPLILKHAGSDLDRLFRVPDLATTYKEILRSSTAVVTQPSLMPRFVGMGVDRSRLERDVPYSLPTDVFHSSAAPLDLAREAIRDPAPGLESPAIAAEGGLPVIGVYGKIGITKGTLDLVTALGQLARDGLDFRLAAMIGGAQGKWIAPAIARADLTGRTFLLPMLPNWRVPAFLRACTAVCFLERDFPVAIHGPIIPREILACGTCLILSGEIAAKQRYRDRLLPGENLFVVEDPRDHSVLAAALRRVIEEQAVARSIGERGLEVSCSIEDHSAFVSGWEELLERNSGGRSRSRPGSVGNAVDPETGAVEFEWLLPDLLAFLHRHCAEVIDTFVPPASATGPFERAVAFCDHATGHLPGDRFGTQLPKVLAVLAYARERLLAAHDPQGPAPAVFAVGDRLQGPAVTLETAAKLTPVRGNAVRIVRFAYDVSDVGVLASVGGHAAVGEDEIDLATIPEGLLLVLFHRSANLIPCALRIDEATRDLVERCDGTRTTAELIDDLCHDFGAGTGSACEQVVERACAALDQLHQAGVIVFGEYRDGRGWTGGVRGRVVDSTDSRRLLSARAETAPSKARSAGTRQDDRERALDFLKEWYPSTMLLLGDRVDRIVGSFCFEPARGGVDPAAEAMRWLELVRSEIARARGLLPYAADVAAYEGTIAALAASEDARADAEFVVASNASRDALPDAVRLGLVPVVGRHVRVESYGFNVPAIVTAIEDCDRLEPVDQPTPVTVLFVASRDGDPPRTALVSDGIRLLLFLCDGIRDCAAVVRLLRGEAQIGDGEDPQREVLDALEALRTRNVLTYREPASTGGKTR
jgi:glycosyltransferase involved in cell wall biosynthesis